MHLFSMLFGFTVSTVKTISVCSKNEKAPRCLEQQTQKRKEKNI